MANRVSQSSRFIKTDLYLSEAPFIPSLNGMRALSVLLVVFAHGGYGHIVPGGLGVTIFFFLSGYLITSLFIVERANFGRISITNFYLRRVFRLVPPLLVTLAFAYILVILGLLPGGITVIGIASQIFYFANYYAIFLDPSGSGIPAGTEILWSLAVEEHFYIIYPVALITLLAAFNNRYFIASAMALPCVVVALWRCYLVFHGADEGRTGYATDTRIDSILFGCMLAAVWTGGTAFRHPELTRTDRNETLSAKQWGLLACSALLLFITIAFRNHVFRETLRYTLQGVALLPIFYFAIKFHSNGLFRFLSTNAMDRVGRYSYFIYLCHFVIIKALLNIHAQIFEEPVVLISATLALSMLYASLMDAVVDPYFRELRRRLR